MRLRIPLH